MIAIPCTQKGTINYLGLFMFIQFYKLFVLKIFL